MGWQATVLARMRRPHAWLARHPVQSAFLIIGSIWVGVAVVAVAVGGINYWQREEACRANGNSWDPHHGCLIKVDECGGDRHIPVGAVFGEGCYACECLRYGGARCRTGILCDWDHNPPCDPSSGTCVFDPGCDAPRAYHALFVPCDPRPYCGCDGVTFVAAAPTKRRRPLGGEQLGARRGGDGGVAAVGAGGDVVMAFEGAAEGKFRAIADVRCDFGERSVGSAE